MRQFLSFLLASLVVCLVPTGAFAHSYGPKPRVTAAPGDDDKACTACHTTAALNSGPGSVKILLQSGAVYIPGVKQHITIQVSDSNQQRWGFEMTARLMSDAAKAAAGEFTPVDNMTQVICEDYGPTPCGAGPAFITHTSAGTRNGSRGGATFQFDWTPPLTNAGPVTLYVAGNAANGNNAPTGDQIYTSSIQLTPAIPKAPSAAAGSIVSAATSLAGPVSPNSWVTVYGTNLGVTTRSWTPADFVNGALPFSLDGVSVLLFGAPRLAYIGYVSPTQVNFLLPSDLTPATVNVQVRNPAGITTNVPLVVQANAPQLFTADGKFALASRADGSALTKAAPGDTITIYATGLGATNPPLTTGQLPASAVSVATLPQVTIGGAPATVSYAGIVAGTAGLYQINVQVPSTAANGDLPLIVSTGTVSSASTLISVQK